MDILLIDHQGVPTVVEAKLIDNREIRRSVLAQGMEYLAHLQSEWTPERMFEEGRKFWADREGDFETEIQKRLKVSLQEEFADRITANLRNSRMRLIIASDQIPPELRTPSSSFSMRHRPLTCMVSKSASSHQRERENTSWLPSSLG